MEDISKFDFFIVLAVLGCLAAAGLAVRRAWVSFQSSDPIGFNPNRSRKTYGGTGLKIGELTQALVEPPYKIYSAEHDVEISSEKLLLEVKSEPARWAEAQSAWELLRLGAGEPTDTWKSMPAQKSLLVTFLVDHSGSLTGEKVAYLVGALDHVSLQLEASEVRFEITGFTTRSWQGGNSRTEWKQNGRPKSPGRLCDLMYIDYKRHGQSYLSVRDFMSVMLVDNIRRENLDGEALLFEFARFNASHFEKWLCIVLSDGAPVDDSTLHENSSVFLENHINHVIDFLTSEPDVTVFGVGVGFDVSRYYPNSVYVKDTSQLKNELVESLDRLLA